MALKPSLPATGIPPQPAPPTAAPLGVASPVRPPARPAPDRRALVVGRGIALSGGAISDCERLEVHGTAEVSIRDALELVIADGGVFRGEAEIEEADISGAFDGAIVASTRLVVRATGTVSGSIRCARLMVEDGAKVSGRIEMITPAAQPGVAPTAPAQPGSLQAPPPPAAPSPALPPVPPEPVFART